MKKKRVQKKPLPAKLDPKNLDSVRRNLRALLKAYPSQYSRVKHLTRLLNKVASGPKPNGEAVKLVSKARAREVNRLWRKALPKVSVEQAYMKRLFRGVENDVWANFNDGRYNEVGRIFKQLVERAEKHAVEQQAADFFVLVAQEMKEIALDSQGLEHKAAKGLLADALAKAMKLYEQVGNETALKKVRHMKSIAEAVFRPKKEE